MAAAVAAHSPDERSPLLACPAPAAPLPSSSSSSSSLVDPKPPADEDTLASRVLIEQEVRYLARQAPPLILGFLLEQAVSLSTVALAGRLGQVELAIVGQGLLISSVTGAVVALAATSAQVTLSAPIFTSPTTPCTDVGVMLQRTVLLANIGMLPVYLLWWQAEPIMLALGQPPSLAAGLRDFMRLMILAMPGYIAMEAGKTFLQSQALMTPSTWIIACLLPLHIALCATLTLATPLGVSGAALAQVATYWLFALALAGWVGRSRARECWGGLSWRALSEGKGTFMWLWLPGIVMYMTEWLSFEFVALLAGRLGETAVAAQAGIASLDGLEFQIPFGLSVVATARFGNLMGLGQISYRRLKALVMASFLLEFGITSLIAVSIVLVRHRLGYLFTPHEETVELIGQVCVAVACYAVADGLQSVAAGILRATGRQSVAAATHCLCYYGLGMPLAFYLAFHRSYGLLGLWAAQATALIAVAVVELALYFLSVDWRAEIAKVERRQEAEGGAAGEGRGLLEG